MKLPYFYQQMLGFFAVILILLNITIFSFYQFTRNSVYTQMEDGLALVAETLGENAEQFSDLSREENFLDNYDYRFFIVNAEGELYYPEDTPEEIERYIPDNIEDLRNGERVTTTVDTTSPNHEEPVERFVLFVPILSDETSEYSGYVAISAPTSQINIQVENLEKHLLQAFLISTIVAVIISVIFARYQVNRINRLRNAAKKVSEGEYNVRIEYNDRDELDSLSRDFNKMILELEKAQKEVERQENRRKTFMQDAAHEMRTPLTTINGLLEGMEHRVISGENQERSVKLMSKETKRLIRLVNENLDYQNIRSHQISLNKNHIPINEIFEDISYQMNRLAIEANNELVIEDSLEMTVWADFDRLKQILVNLIKNAIQFTENGQITVSVVKTMSGTKISVKDNGIGMTEEQIENIWERYYKVDPSRRNTSYGESGLGLSIVYHLVQEHKAQIDVKSQKDKGTVFTVEFPDSVEQSRELHKQRPTDIIE